MSNEARSRRVAIDIGGTFTDLVSVDIQTGETVEEKVPTTPSDFAEGVINVLEVSDVELSSVAQLIHGTTVVINAITQRSGARTALVTTSGFRDALEIGRGNRPDMYNLRFHKPSPFVPRRFRFEVAERVRPDGSVETPLQEDELAAIAETCIGSGIEAIAVCFLHSYAYPDHEQRAADILRARLPDVPISISSDITKEWREFERSSTAVLNAYVGPSCRHYLDHLDRELGDHGATDQRFAMTSNGGTATFSFARDQPIQLVESGPAGGIIGAQVLGERIGEPNIITLDIGGTTAKCSIIVDGEIAISGDYRLEHSEISPGYPVRIPVIDIVEIGAGGGSIVWFDNGGGLRIGPRSAGAHPGPACYGAGGTDATITDTLVCAGIIEPGPLPGSSMQIDAELARRSIEPIANRLGIEIDDAVTGILDLFTELTVDALKLISVKRGHDPRDFSLVAFGGGGPIHAARLGEELGVKRVLIPNLPATFSAWGMLQAQPRIDLTRTHVCQLDETDTATRSRLFSDLEKEASDKLVDQGFDRSTIERRSLALDMRYQGQEHTVRVVVPEPETDESWLSREFHDEHRKMYTFSLEDTAIELVNFRVIHQVRTGGLTVPASVRGNVRETAVDRRRVRLSGSAGVAEVSVFDRSNLEPGFSENGPALVRESASTTIVPTDARFRVDEHGNIVISFNTTGNT